jgi:hypothetical protein
MSGVSGVPSASNLHNPILRKKNENKKIDNSEPNELRSGKLAD